MSATDHFVALGVITSAHGIKGAVKIKLFTDSPDRLFAYDSLQDAQANPVKLKQIGEAKGQIICTLEGIRYRDAAEKLKGTEIGVMRSELAEPDPDEVYIEDLIGIEVVDAFGNPFGTILAIHNFGAGDIVEIRTDEADVMFSYTETIFPELDLEARRMVIHPPEIVQAAQ